MNPNNPGHLKVKLLVDGIRMQEESIQGIGQEFQEKIYSYSLTDWVDKKIVLPSDIKLEQEVFVGFRYNPQSDWELRAERKGVILIHNSGFSRDAKLVLRPSYYDILTREGKKMQSIGVSCGNHGVSFFLNSYCEYFRNDENCKFCGLVPTQKKFSDTIKLKSVEQVRETTEKILDLKCPIDFFQLSGGSLYDHDQEVRTYMPFIGAISSELKKRNLDGKIPIHLTSMPPRDLNILYQLKDIGLNTISFDLECPGEEYFKKYCPGKTKSYGYENIRAALIKAKKIFGQGNVFSILILGIEPNKSFLRNLEGLLVDGITPTLNVYHYDPFCALDMDIKNPNPEEIISSAEEISALFKSYGVSPGSLGCAHYDIGHEIKGGYFENAR